MYENFEGLAEGKKKRILDACMEEFAEKGFERASTNTIVKKAGISKGILFHYFLNKKNLYLYMADYAVQYLMSKYFSSMLDSSDDIFERTLDICLRKLDMAYEEPLLYKFLARAYLDTPPELREEMQQRYDKLTDTNIPLLLKGISTEKFRKDIDERKAIEVIILFLEALSQKYMKLYKGKSEEISGNMEGILREYREYIEILKGGIYGY